MLTKDLDSGLLKKIGGEVYAIEPLTRNANANYGLVESYNAGLETQKTSLNGKHDWLKNGCGDVIPLIHRQLFRDSGIHRSAIELKSALIAGGGLEFTVPEVMCRKNAEGFYEEIESSFSDSQIEQLIKEARLFLKNVNEETYRQRAASNTALYGGYYGFRFFADKSDNSRYLENLFVEKYINVRLGATRTRINNKFESTRHYISDDFQTASALTHRNYKTYTTERKPFKSGNLTSLPVYDGLNHPDQKQDVLSKCVWQENDYRDYYATPDYETRKFINYACSDYLVSVHDKKGISSGLSVDHVIVRYRDPLEDPEKEKQKRQGEALMMRDSFKGAGGEKSMLMWAKPHRDDNGNITTPKLLEFIEVPRDNNPERLNILREETKVSILNAHGIITGELIALPSLKKSGLSSQSDYLTTALQQMYWNKILPAQRIYEQDINDELILRGLPVQVKVKKSIPVLKQASDTILQWAYTMDEVRGQLGDQKLTEEQKVEIAERIVTNTDTNGGV